MHGFWQSLKGTGFLSLAPMEDVTDTTFREVVMRCSDPSVLKVLFTEFTSTDGLCDARGREKVAQRLKVNPSEKSLLQQTGIKLVAQIWGNDPQKFYESAQYITKLHLFDGIDINMGCPVKKVVKKNTCSALIQYPKLAVQIIEATRSGTDLPVSVKTRIGFNHIDTENWVSHLLDAQPAAITLHGRTQKQMSDGEADWNEVKKAVALRDKCQSQSLLIGNGDITSYNDAMQRVGDTGVDGTMVGRGIFKNVFLFNRHINHHDYNNELEVLLMHIRKFSETWCDMRNYNELKRFYKVYVSGFNGAAALRSKLMETQNAVQAIYILLAYLNQKAVPVA